MAVVRLRTYVPNWLLVSEATLSFLPHGLLQLASSQEVLKKNEKKRENKMEVTMLL